MLPVELTDRTYYHMKIQHLCQHKFTWNSKKSNKDW